MSEEKQIEEMASILENAKIDALATIGSMNHGFGVWYAQALYNAGYRKQSDGAWITFHCTNGGKSKRGRTIIYKTYTCDACGKTNGRHKTNYCPNCGAKMKGGAE